MAFQTLAEAMAFFEGFGRTPTNAPTRNNNPGALVSGPFTDTHGAIGTDTRTGLATFPDATTGLQAQMALIESYSNKGLNLQQLIEKWSPPNAPGNSTEATRNYIKSVSDRMGISPNTPLSELKDVPRETSTQKTPEQKSTTPSISSIAFGPAGWIIDSLGGFERLGTFVLALIAVAAGLYMFRPVQDAVNTGVKTVAKIA